MSKDNCRTFSTLVSIVKAKPAAPTKDCNDVSDSWYLDFQQDQSNNIIVSYNYHVCKNMKPDYSERNNVYYMVLDTDTNTWKNIQGKNLQLPITKEFADKMTLAVNTENKRICLRNRQSKKSVLYSSKVL